MRQHLSVTQKWTTPSESINYLKRIVEQEYDSLTGYDLEIRKTAEMEIYYMEQAAASIFVSNTELDLVSSLSKSIRGFIVSNIYDTDKISMTPTALSERHGCIFVGKSAL